MSDSKIQISEFLTRLRKWSPGIALAVLTFALMIFFKSNQGNFNTILEEGKGQITKLFSENLQPLVEETPISNEDVFNFALYRNLPVKKDRKKILQINADEVGNEYFEILPASVRPETKNYDNFVSYLKLDDDELDSLNSLLDSYRYPIYASILVKDDETMAVDPNIINIHRALLADLMRFGYSINPVTTREIIPADYDFISNPELPAYIKEVKTVKPTEYVFYTPDSVFNVKCEVDKEKFYAELKEVEKLKHIGKTVHLSNFINIPEIVSSVTESRDGLMYNWGSEDSSLKIYPSHKYINDNIEPELRDLNTKLGEFTFQMTVGITEMAKLAGELSTLYALDKDTKNLSFDPDTDFKFEFNLDNLASGIDTNFLSNNEKDWEEFGLRMQAMALKFASQFSDSLSQKDQAALKAELQRVKEELKKAGREMEKARRLSKPNRK